MLAGVCMSYFVRRWHGARVRDLPTVQFAAVLAELADADEEHGSVALQHESGWCLSYGRSGTLLFEQVESVGPADRFHLPKVNHDTVVQLWRSLARGDIAHLRKEPWLPGYG
jgi:hypothetical protein